MPTTTRSSNMFISMNMLLKRCLAALATLLNARIACAFMLQTLNPLLQGLLRYSYYDSQSKDITLLTTHVSASSPIDPGSQITYANDLAIASDGTIYFTSSTDIVPQLNQHGYYDTYRAWLLSMMQVRRRQRQQRLACMPAVCPM
eukprot:GHRQ01018540.1.p1 GENE.GHRQ01018540.1~~GHRQ01018540.1.p1  ORF type:complete len:145 (+),score=31.90 GHRQ01018540.1:276-710(+)